MSDKEKRKIPPPLPPRPTKVQNDVDKEIEKINHQKIVQLLGKRVTHLNQAGQHIENEKKEPVKKITKSSFWCCCSAEEPEEENVKSSLNYKR